MKLFILQSKQQSRMNWSEFARKIKKSTDSFHLVTSSNLQSNTANPYKNVFDTVDILPENDKKLVQAVLTKYEFNREHDHIVTNDEYCVELCANINDSFHMPSGYTLKNIAPYLNKYIAKQKLKDTEITIPTFIKHEPEEYKKTPRDYVKKIEKALGFPMIGKPVDEANNRDITYIDTKEKLSIWLDTHSTSEKYELESYIAGDLYHCNSMFYKNKLHILTVGMYLNPCLEFSNKKPIGSLFLPSNSELYREIVKFNEKVLNILSFPKNCVFHLELFKTKDNSFIFLEVACRAPGALIPRATEIAYGYNIEELNLLLQMDKFHNNVDEILLQKNNLKKYSAWAWFPTLEGKVSRIKNLPVNSEYKLEWNIQLNDIILPLITGSSVSPACEITLSNKNFDDLKSDFLKLKNYAPFEVNPISALKEPILNI